MNMCVVLEQFRVILLHVQYRASFCELDGDNSEH